MYYTVFWDNSNGVPDDKSFSQQKDAEAFYDSLDVPFKKLNAVFDNGEMKIKSYRNTDIPS